MIGRDGTLQYFTFCSFEMYVSMVFVIRCLCSAVSLTLVREQCFIRTDDDDDNDDDDDDRFCIVLFSALEQTCCAFVTYGSKW